MRAGVEQKLAESLATSLRWRRVRKVAVRGAGAHWSVTATSAHREAIVHCFFYARAYGVVLGINQANNRSRLRPPPAERRAGPEYLVRLSGDSVAVDGRTRSGAQAVDAVRRWMRGASLDAVVRCAEFIDADGRMLRPIAATLDARLRWHISADPEKHLWVFGDALRACQIAVTPDSICCAYRLGHANVAYSSTVDLAAVHAWLLDGISVVELPNVDRRVELERHVRYIESEPSRWSWSQTLDRLADERDVLYPMRVLVEALAESPIASQFYVFSSLDRLCFSASSHYPWVTPSCPVVSPLGDASVSIGGRVYSYADAVTEVERCLVSCPVVPFFGNSLRFEVEELNDALGRVGSALVAVVAMAGDFSEIRVEHGHRRCSFTLLLLIFTGEGDERLVDFTTIDDAARAAHWYCVEGRSVDDIAWELNGRGVAEL